METRQFANKCTTRVLTGRRRMNNLWSFRALYLFILPSLALTFLFSYLPMFSNAIAFMDYKMTKGWLGLGSPFVGLKHFKFVMEPWFYTLVGRTLVYSLSVLLTSFPASVILALLINELRGVTFKKISQTVSYIPHFVSWVTVAGLFYVFLTYDQTGIVNDIKVVLVGGERYSYMQYPDLFLPFLILSQLWKETGWGSILYLATIVSIDQQLYEAAWVDGAGRFRQMLHITLPCLIPTASIILIMSMGGVLSTNFEQIFNL